MFSDVCSFKIGGNFDCTTKLYKTKLKSRYYKKYFKLELIRIQPPKLPFIVPRDFSLTDRYCKESLIY